MSKKKLLEENTVSKFMKLAKIDNSRSKRFLTEMYGYDEKKSAPEEEEEGSYGMHEMGYGKEEKEEMGYGMDEMGGYGEEPMNIDELDLDKYMNEAEEEEEGEGEEMGELSMTSEEAQDIVSALEKLLDKLKTAVEAKPAEEEPEMEEPEAPEGEEEMAAPEGEEEAPEGEEETPAALQEALVNKVARRVAARLLRESKAKAAVKKPVKPKK